MKRRLIDRKQKGASYYCKKCKVVHNSHGNLQIYKSHKDQAQGLEDILSKSTVKEERMRRDKIEWVLVIGVPLVYGILMLITGKCPLVM